METALEKRIEELENKKKAELEKIIQIQRDVKMIKGKIKILKISLIVIPISIVILNIFLLKFLY